MKCSKIQKKLSDYLDNALSDNKKAEIANHLQSCPSCQAEFSALKNLQSTLSLLDNISVPDGFSGSLTDKIHGIERKTEIAKPYTIFSRAVMAAACAAGLLLSIIFGNHIGKTLYKETAGKKILHDSRVTEILKTQASIELAGYLKNNIHYSVLNGGVQ